MMSTPIIARPLGNLQHIVVLMLENRSFDHVLGTLKSKNAAIAGALDGEYSNPADPAVPGSPPVATGPATEFAMPFDPGHEFLDVQLQLYGRATLAERIPAARVQPARMNGFVYSAENAAQNPSQAAMVMQCFHPERLPVLTTLAQEFAVFNYWHSSLPGPTWPNRFFVHCATSGGLTDSPRDPDILAGYSFPAGTIYERLARAGKRWRIYHDGLPQAVGIDSLRDDFVNVFTENFREMEHFEEDIAGRNLPEYVFIEPNYDTSHEFVGGNSMHPRNDARKGELLIKQVYERLRASPFWTNTLLIVTFDEHGGFFDHVPPPAAVPPGGDQRYRSPADHFDFDLLGVRVPAIAVSAYTGRGTVIGGSPEEFYDHTSILTTVEKRFGLSALSLRDGDSRARTLESALNLTAPRMGPEEAPMTLPTPVEDSRMARAMEFFSARGADLAAPMSDQQRVQLTLAHAIDLRMGDAGDAPERYLGARSRADAAQYIQQVEDRVRVRRKSARAPVKPGE